MCQEGRCVYVADIVGVFGGVVLNVQSGVSAVFGAKLNQDRCRVWSSTRNHTTSVVWG